MLCVCVRVELFFLCIGKPPMQILELFCGTKSISKCYAQDPTTSIITVDLNPCFAPTHVCCVLEFDYKKYAHFDYIHASPPCTEYSSNQHAFYGRMRKVQGVSVPFNPEVHEQEMQKSDKLVLRVLQIIEYFKPACWTIENPRSLSPNTLLHRPVVRGLPYQLCSYCMYGHALKKNTVFWNNFKLQLKQCTHYNQKHMAWADWARKPTGMPRLHMRYVIPHLLCQEIRKQVLQNI